MHCQSCCLTSYWIIDIRGNLYPNMVQISAYADNVDMSRNPKALNEALQELDNTAQEIGLLRSQEKDKNVSINKKTHNQCKQIGIGGYRVSRVSRFSYLGSIINDDNSMSEELTHGITKGNRAYYACK